MQELKIPISSAKRFLKEHDLDEVIIISRKYKPHNNEKDTTQLCVTTYGKTKQACEFAASFGKQLTEIIKAQLHSFKEAYETKKGNQ